MWRHMTCDCEIALVLRLALDDASSGVVAAAAAGLHALLDSRGGASQNNFPDPGERLVPCVLTMMKGPKSDHRDIFLHLTCTRDLFAGADVQPALAAPRRTVQHIGNARMGT